jgi:hypothetical protein
MDVICSKCNGAGWYQYDDNHSKPCEVCCTHDKGWFLLKDYYGVNNGKYSCVRGCGKVIDEDEKASFEAQGCIQTYTGVMFDPLKPNADKVYLLDIGHALSQTVRYGGHAIRHYSVAEHCVHVCRTVRKKGGNAWEQLDAILHDAPEAYIQDLVRPVKKRLHGYFAIEDLIMTVIYNKYYVRKYTGFSDLVHEVDYGMLADEAAQNMATPEIKWSDLGKPNGVKLRYWGVTRAKFEYLSELISLLMKCGVISHRNLECGESLDALFARPAHKMRLIDRVIVNYLTWRERLRLWFN